MKLKFKYLVLGNHPLFIDINRLCVSYPEALNIKDGLEVVGYEVEIKPIKGDLNFEKTN